MLGQIGRFVCTGFNYACKLSFDRLCFCISVKEEFVADLIVRKDPELEEGELFLLHCLSNLIPSAFKEHWAAEALYFPP